MVCLASCAMDERQYQVQISEEKLEFNSLWKRQGFTATVTPSYATFKDVIWSSDNPDVAVVNSKGIVTAVSEGMATITARTEDGEFTDEATVVVGELVTSLNDGLDDDAISVYPNPLDKQQLTIHLGRSGMQGYVSIFDNTGRLVYRGTGSGKVELDNTKLEGRGIYLINILFEDGKKEFRKLIKMQLHSGSLHQGKRTIKETSI